MWKHKWTPYGGTGLVWVCTRCDAVAHSEIGRRPSPGLLIQRYAWGRGETCNERIVRKVHTS